MKRYLRGLRARKWLVLLLRIGAAIGLPWRERRVRGVEDMDAVAGVPVIGVLRPAGSKAPVFRRWMPDAAEIDDDEPLLSAAPGAQT